LRQLLDQIPSEKLTERIAAIWGNKENGIVIVARYKNYYGRRYIDIRKYSLTHNTWMKQGIMIPVEKILYLIANIACYIDDPAFLLRQW